ncbi:uncharacterized protein [Spinacia oleracea]|uniref:RNase H type-1 domain-containing protein n=1 Tax=Spinacia oleracea TaxID=3562 RepID=A0ABM3R857_SPIOL|nr:uncharacterized protein LOC130467346 [Spinacia oleracea]
MFRKQLGDTMEVYIDDILVKSKKASDHISHLQQAFDFLREYSMKLNPTKCSFGASSAKFMGYMVTQRGIEARPDQIRAFINLQSPRSQKDVQKLAGRLVALNRFISRSSDKCKLFYDILKKNEKFSWTDQHEAALQQLKQYLSEPSLLSKPKDKEELQVYLAVTESTISAVLVRQEDDKQLPIYYVSKSLLSAETRYSHLEKLVLALIVASTKLRPYFKCHPITVRTNYPMKSIMRKPELSGRMSNWKIQLGCYDISPSIQHEVDKEVNMLTDDGLSSTWTLYTDGSSNIRGTWLGIVLKSPQGDTIIQTVCCEFKATNNEAEYEGLIIGLSLELDMNIPLLEVRCDSLLIISQINGLYATKDSKMQAYLEVDKRLVDKFDSCTLQQIPRDRNTQDDALANLGSNIKSKLTSIPVVHLMYPAITKETLSINEQSPPTQTPTSWRNPYIHWLKHHTIPPEITHERSFRMRACRFILIHGVLFRKSVAGPYLRFLDHDEIGSTLRNIHDG